MSKPFKFKEFSVEQDKCAMKIGTDGVLLGAWATVNQETDSILDIGSGTGLLALMLAQRSTAELIDAIEIDADAYEQCVVNFENSIWADRLFCYHASLLEFIEEIEDQYQLIVSNPPFYEENVSSGNNSRDIARQNTSMPFTHLIEAVSLLLTNNGIFATIIPFKEEENFISLAKNYGLFVTNICHVQGNENSPIKRSLLQFSRKESTLKTTVLCIEKERHIYTQDYINLTKDFYLKM